MSNVVKSHLNSVLNGKSLQAYQQQFAQDTSQPASLIRTAITAELNILLALETLPAALESLFKPHESVQGKAFARG